MKQALLEEHLGPDWKDITAELTAKSVMKLCITLALHSGDLDSASKIATSLIAYEEAKPMQQTAVTVQGAFSNMSLADMMRLREEVANSTDAEFTLVTSREELE